MTKIGLQSDFRDYYDHWFESKGSPCDFVFNRMSRSPPYRQDALILMRTLGLRVPRFDSVYNLSKTRIPSEHLVVYTDETAHCGDGKVLVSVTDDLNSMATCLATEYKIPDGPEIASYRYLRIGRQSFWIRYSSDDAWRSNCGEVECAIVPGDTVLTDHLSASVVRYPLWAIDFVQSDAQLWAIDFNASPGISGTGVELIFKPKFTFTEIQRWFVENRDVYDSEEGISTREF